MKKNKNGFTLVELVIVIAVIAILASILIPTFSGILKRADESAKMQTAKSARDELLSTYDEFASITDIDGYVILVDDSVYTLNNGELILNPDLDSESVHSEYSQSEKTVSSNGIVIFEPKSAETYISFELDDVSKTAKVTGCAKSVDGALNIPSYVGGVIRTETDRTTYDNFDMLRWDIQDEFMANQNSSKVFTIYYNNGTTTNSMIVNSWNYYNLYSISSYSDYVVEQPVNVYSIGGEYKVTEIGDRAFQFNYGITSVYIPGTVTRIGEYGFASCNSLTDVTLCEGVVNLDLGAFYDCQNLENIDLPDSIETIGEICFDSDYLIEELHLPASLIYCDKDAFERTAMLTNYEDNDAYYWGTTSNPHYVLLKAKSRDILQANIHEDTKIICGGAFGYCNKITEIRIPEGVVSLGSYSFISCTAVTKIYMSSTVEIIRDSSFAYLQSVTDYYYAGTTDQWCYMYQNYAYPWSSFHFHANGQEVTNFIMPDDITKIRSYNFFGMKYITSITIPDTVTEFGYYAFNDMTSLVNIYFNGTQEQWNSITKRSTPVASGRNLYINGVKVN